MKDYVFVTKDYRGHWRLQWFIVEDDCEGAVLGEYDYAKEELETHLSGKNGEDREFYIAEIAALDRSGAPGRQHDRYGHFWESEKEAKAALRIVKAALKNDGGRPMPDWAKQALAAGWKAPKGWKP